ncbi:MAG: glycoside hydrolase family 2 TIM barrel-domain containing protein [Armatimonadota bacterium]|nr:glycoside hydrolase family 2 TIM barrel-domain containing protein [Armatimonadota bacterium]
MQLCLDGNDWSLVPLLPHEFWWRQAWKESWSPKGCPPWGEWIRACVPGDVIADALDAGLIPHPYKDLNSLACEWLSERDWVYRKQFRVPEEWQGKHVRLRFDGVDDACEVYLNERLLGKHEGMFLPFEFDVTEHLRFGEANSLTVLVEHMPPVDVVQGQIGWTSRARRWKARFAYDWDWCTRLVPLGIWQSVSLLASDGVWVEDVWVRPRPEGEGAQVEARIQLHSVLPEASEWSLQLCVISPEGDFVAYQNEPVYLQAGARMEYVATLGIPSPQLWYPHDMGEQPLYRLRATLAQEGNVSVVREVTFGIRTVRAVANKDAPPDALPYTLEVNGKSLFVKGWNWVPHEQMYGRVRLERYERLLKLAREAGCNLLRVWGGGLLEREEFYNLCDRLGILVWQEFPLSSSGIQNAPPEDEEYLQYIEAQARQMVPLRRNHPSLVLWCGGNELMDDQYVPLTDAHPALARLKSVVQELDPERLWLPTSASGPVEGASAELAGTSKMHDVHGPWVYLGAEEHYRFYNTIDPLYHSEFGVEGAANLPIFERFISPEYWFPPDATNRVWLHHGSWWTHREKLEALFGRIEDLETFIRASQWMQAEGLRYAIESHRRRQGRCSGVSPWQFNEPYPNTACTNVVDYLGQPKPAYWWARRAYQPVHVSLRYEKLTWQPGEEWQAEVWVHGADKPIRHALWAVCLNALDGRELARAEGAIENLSAGASCVAQIRLPLPQEAGVWVMVACLYNRRGGVLSCNEYLFSTAQPPMQPLLHAPPATLRVWHRRQHVGIKNIGETVALLVQLTPQDGQWLHLEDNYFCLLPGEARVLDVEGRGTVVTRAWNSEPHYVHL